MAASEASATARPQPQAARERTAARAAPVRRLCRQVCDTVPPYFVGALRVCNVTVIALIGTRWACGRDSRAAAVARKAYHLALDALGLLAPFGGPLLFLKIESCRMAQAREVQASRRPESNGARLLQDRGGLASVPGTGLDSFHLAMFIAGFAAVVMAVALLVQELAPGKGSPQAKFSAALGDIANFVGVIILEFVTFYGTKFIWLSQQDEDKVCVADTMLTVLVDIDFPEPF
ncbi:hypothetical protein EJB05_49169, partial [Eragrostis curvula]